jgi:hypothetical protein
MLKNGFASYHSESSACHSDAERSEAEESLYFRIRCENCVSADIAHR